ncbi:MAG: phosphoadenylyl-sulfate reductase [Bacteroidia bacterium]
MMDALKEQLEAASAADGLKLLNSLADGKLVFSTSFGIEDQVITDMVFGQKLDNIEVFTLDTGRLFAETYATWDKTLLNYSKKIKPYYPEQTAIETFVRDNGINAFYGSVALRKSCCGIRKVAPLQRALQGVSVWVTGLRAEQSANRSDMKKVEWDETHQLYKYNPLMDWTFDQVQEYIRKNAVPYNPLHDKGFVSIGCAPCTRAVQEGEDFRAGRWWWEDASKKECGLHTHN